MCARHVTHNQLLASNAVPLEGLAVRVNSCNKQVIHQNVPRQISFTCQHDVQQTLHKLILAV